MNENHHPTTYTQKTRITWNDLLCLPSGDKERPMAMSDCCKGAWKSILGDVMQIFKNSSELTTELTTENLMVGPTISFINL